MMTTIVCFFNGALPFKSEAKIVRLTFINSHHFQSKSLGQDYAILHEKYYFFFLLKEGKSLNDFFTAISRPSNGFDVNLFCCNCSDGSNFDVHW